MLNIHPSLLPAFKGLDTHGRALAAGAKRHGATVHFVVPEIDAGPIIAQDSGRGACDDTEETLAARVLEVEHRIYPRALRAWRWSMIRKSGNRFFEKIMLHRSARASIDLIEAIAVWVGPSLITLAKRRGSQIQNPPANHRGLTVRADKCA